MRKVELVHGGQSAPENFTMKAACSHDLDRFSSRPRQAAQGSRTRMLATAASVEQISARMADASQSGVAMSTGCCI